MGGGIRSPLRRTHGRWAVVPAATFPDSRSAWLAGVAAISPRNAWAVGAVSLGSRGAPPDDALIEHWDGHAWKRYPIGTHHSWLRRIVRIPHTSHLWAVGETVPWSPRPVAAYWDGRRWTFTRLPLPAGAVAEGVPMGSMAVAAVAENDVWMVGFTAGPAGGPHASPSSFLTWHWNGLAWKVTRRATPFQEPHIVGIAAVPRSSQLWAVGSSERGAGTTTLVAHYSRGRWRVVPTPGCRGLSLSYLNGVAAVTTTDVWAVGACASPETPGGHALIERFDGRRWHVVPALRHAAELTSITSVPRKGRRAIWRSAGPVGIGCTSFTPPTSGRSPCLDAEAQQAA